MSRAEGFPERAESLPNHGTAPTGEISGHQVVIIIKNIINTGSKSVLCSCHGRDNIRHAEM